MPRYYGNALAFTAMAIYLVGGAATFSGLGLIVFAGGSDVWGWGDGRSLGYLFFCVGLLLSIAGVLIMRILRNRIPA